MIVWDTDRGVNEGDYHEGYYLGFDLEGYVLADGEPLHERIIVDVPEVPFREKENYVMIPQTILNVHPCLFQNKLLADIKKDEEKIEIFIKGYEVKPGTTIGIEAEKKMLLYKRKVILRKN